MANFAGGIVTLAAIAGAIYWWLRRERNAAAQTAAQTAAVIRQRQEAEAAARQSWRELTFEPGSFSVLLTGFRESGAQEGVAAFLGDIPELRDQTEEIQALIQRVIHVSAQPVAEGISQDHAITLKEALDQRGAKVRIREFAARRASTRREPIPKRVRNEVWRRDQGRCVDCGSQERLEYDHIIAVANGGSNTARNIELRCETCNRRKGARV